MADKSVSIIIRNVPESVRRDLKVLIVMHVIGDAHMPPKETEGLNQEGRVYSVRMGIR